MLPIGIVATSLAITVVAVVGVWIYMVSNVETPSYEVVEADGAMEIREYGAQRVAEVVKTGDRREAVSRGFSPLARYIFAKERDGEKIAMTAPVTQQSTEGESWRVQFIMPAEYEMVDLPSPADRSVTLHEIEPSRRAAIRFSGVANDNLIAEQESKLRDWLAERGVDVAGSEPTYAYYNDPMTPGPLRRNEVMFILENNPGD